MPAVHRRDIRRWQDRRARRRRRVRLVGSAGTLVVAMAVLLSAAPGANAPTREVVTAPPGDGLASRVQDVASRGGERTADPAPAEPSPLTSSAVPQTAPAPADGAADVPPAPPAPPASPSPQPQAAAQPPAAPADAAGALAAEIVTLTSAERTAAGLPALATSACATEQAAARAALLVAQGRFEHDPLGPVLEACAAGTVGENLSLGYPTAQGAVAGWMASPGHRENILRPAYTQIGVGCAAGARGWLCAQVFLG
ncbi:CAP domain-containing protein [Cellulomonas sp. zg-ZUI222]|uniref:CAP domain-containing protein n=1 Tax=Cellulomonas wangleii TaxID=2816956 RepID=A0ABX8D6L2_9CELL|nr:CAP domain-containing protein [Cellulomonas wangleii]MBO0922478.1 CAP domain-containing protein [Cellulomonas wangleii]MBO0924919.1 CAP domain-containing protein [Cellulomonas wangleii]MBO0926819.1 CAP domain-containing protein [Cellulomonas wangleii]QVI63081.1 CAP domain-containing protein [Cellulomonas wangleii]